MDPRSARGTYDRGRLPMLAACACVLACADATAPEPALPVTPGRYVLRWIDGEAGPPWVFSAPTGVSTLMFDTLRIFPDSTYYRRQFYAVWYRGIGGRDYDLRNHGRAIPDGRRLHLYADTALLEATVERDTRSTIRDMSEVERRVWQLDSSETRRD